MKRRLMIIVVWLSVMAMAKAQSGLNIAPLFEGKIIPQERMVETRVKGKMLSKYQLTFFRSIRFEAKDKAEIRRVHDMIEQDQKANPNFAYAENYFSQKSHAKESLMLQLSKNGTQNRFLCYKRKDNDVTVVYIEGTINSVYALKDILK